MTPSATASGCGTSLRFPGIDFERSLLYEAGLLDDREREELVKEWRDEFNKSFADCFFHTAQGEILVGWRARREHHAWADIPRRLIFDWTIERRRSAKTISKLKDADDAA